MSYLHGYSENEAARLRAQARTLAPWVHRGQPLRACKSILEVGSGVGGQTEILLEEYPGAHITALEIDERNHAACETWLRHAPGLKARAQALLGDATAMSEAVKLHDGAFLCWVLEHCPDPIAVLRGTRERLHPGGLLVAHEVFQQSWFVGPTFPPLLDRYLRLFNQLQTELGGDPNVGARLGQHLHEAGFVDIETSAVLIMFDDRDPNERAAFFDYLAPLLRSAEPGLIERGRVSRQDGDELERLLSTLGRTPGTIFSYTILRATAQRPQLAQNTAGT